MIKYQTIWHSGSYVHVFAGVVFLYAFLVNGNGLYGAGGAGRGWRKRERGDVDERCWRRGEILTQRKTGWETLLSCHFNPEYQFWLATVVKEA